MGCPRLFIYLCLCTTPMRVPPGNNIDSGVEAVLSTSWQRLGPWSTLYSDPHTEFDQPIMSPKQKAVFCSRSKPRSHQRVFRNVVEMPSQRRAALCCFSPSSSFSDWRIHNVTGIAQERETQVGLGLSSATDAIAYRNLDRVSRVGYPRSAVTTPHPLAKNVTLVASPTRSG